MMDGEKWNMEHTRWFKDKVFYQIWPRSFRDGNGDGIGDLWGVLEKLDYLQELGIDGVWFSPLYPSPGADCGYDISDYMDIAPEYGGMEAFRAVLDGLHQRGMKLILELATQSFLRGIKLGDGLQSVLDTIPTADWQPEELYSQLLYGEDLVSGDRAVLNWNSSIYHPSYYTLIIKSGADSANIKFDHDGSVSGIYVSNY